jgi:hypothetical protein
MSYGNPSPYGYQPHYPPPRRGASGLGIAALAIGGGILALCIVGGILVGAVVLARATAVARNRPQPPQPVFQQPEGPLIPAPVTPPPLPSIPRSPPPLPGVPGIPPTIESARPPRPRPHDMASAMAEVRSKREEKVSGGFRGDRFPPNSKKPIRVTEIKVGMEVWALGRGNYWYKSTILSIDGLRVLVHFHGSADSEDEEVPLTKIRLSTEVHSPTDFATSDADTNPFGEAVATAKRTWTDNTGKFKIEAEFVKLSGGRVTLRRDDGTEITLTLDRLSETDRRIAQQLAEM